MSFKISRIAALASTLAVASVMSIFIAAPASAAVTPITEANCPSPPNFLLGPFRLKKPVNGFMEIHKLGQDVALNGGEFVGTDALCIEAEVKVTGSITEGSIVFPAFTAPIKLAGQTAEITGEIKQFGPGEGTIDKPAGETCTPTTCNAEEAPFINLNVQAQANLRFSNLKLFGLSIPVQCETAKPISLPFVKSLTLEELLVKTTITGSTTMPPVGCKGLLGPLEGLIFTGLFSGPNNAYSLEFGESTFA
jgi:hypothetical protein